MSSAYQGLGSSGLGGGSSGNNNGTGSSSSSSSHLNSSSNNNNNNNTSSSSSSNGNNHNSSNHRRLFNGWNYQPADPPPLPPPPPPPGLGSQRNGCVSNFSPYSSSLHGPTLPHNPYSSFGTGTDFLPHQFNPLNQLSAASHRNLSSFYPDLYGHHHHHHHHQSSPTSLAGRSLLTDLGMPPRFDSDPLGSYIADSPSGIRIKLQSTHLRSFANFISF
ncbi:hypothetical protein HELRODRAFT_183291 [Helobdella robusta]|uniref:Uncharacterized protein n=1 Tax=Helobdella robusta TaxID=6412 RepID=T1FJF3_HELRO|nr:hypothetical protein HELRODRAFT_183291 [Helobdella robusta]ESO11347.1 hypothetical protein HELRODRAFT_183291 [Helobdella robusta]